MLFLCIDIGLASSHPLAEHLVPSTAPLGDCEFQSGALSGRTVYGHTDVGGPFEVCRVGEASHPGPYQNIVLGCSNPSGLRNRESLAIGQGPGIWTYSETQFSNLTQISSARALRAAARMADRHVRPVFGAPATLRPRSTWAGSWTGVACISDYPVKKLQIEWPQEVWDSGRVLATQHFVGKNVLTVVSLYGLPRGPTWPHAAQIMNDILAFVSKTFVFGHSGLVAIQGDYNFGPHELGHFHLWRSLGWTDAQSLAEDRWSQARQPTAKEQRRGI
eukprot:Skav235686  [mRNA]  locus=scaffold280:101237:102061:+ [translate_table: standard]